MSSAKLTISDLQAQMKAIQAEIEARRVSAKNELRMDIEQMLKDADFTLSDIFPDLAKGTKANGSKAKKAEVAAKYMDPKSGDLWSGRGRSPKWVVAIMEERGISITEFKEMAEFAA